MMDDGLKMQPMSKEKEYVTMFMVSGDYVHACQ